LSGAGGNPKQIINPNLEIPNDTSLKEHQQRHSNPKHGIPNVFGALEFRVCLVFMISDLELLLIYLAQNRDLSRRKVFQGFTQNSNEKHWQSFIQKENRE
jgi:hypothetical protein